MLALAARKRIVWFLWLVTLHSFAVGLGLIFLPARYMAYFGFVDYTASFFQVQGGVFHLVMSVAYFLAAKYLEKSPGLIHFIITAKSMAFVFLVIYFFFVEAILMVLLSAAGDGLMAAVVYFLFNDYKERIKESA